MLAHRERRLFTPEEYLSIEEKSASKSEFYQGEIFAMSGGTLEHAQIVRDLTIDLGQALRGSDCQVLGSDLRLQVARHKLFTYPDLYVVCGEPRRLLGRTDTLTDATLIIEVLSPGTEFYDRGEKFLLYQGLPSFREYLLISQDQRKVEHHVRLSRGGWRSETFAGGASFQLKSFPYQLVVDDLYRSVKSPTETE